MRRSRRTQPLPALAAAIFALTGCGGEREFSAEELVEEANSNGAGLVLGEPLESTRENAEIRTLTFEDAGADDEGEEPGHAHGGGTLTIAADADAGLAEYERCERAVSLVCFRASNAVILFDGGIEPEHRAALEGALRAMASE